MAVRTLSFEMDEADIFEIEEIAKLYNISMSDLINTAVKEYLATLQSDPFYRLTMNMQEASAEESDEILSQINSLTDDDLTIVSSKKFIAQEC